MENTSIYHILMNRLLAVWGMQVTMFSQYSNPQFEVEPVEVISPDGKSAIYPDLSLRTFEVDMAYINGTIGTSLQAQEVCILNLEIYSSIYLQ